MSDEPSSVMSAVSPLMPIVNDRLKVRLAESEGELLSAVRDGP